MAYIFVDREGGSDAMRSQMRDEMRRSRGGNRYYDGARHDGGRSYEDGYREGYKHGYEDCDDEREDEYRRGRKGMAHY